MEHLRLCHMNHVPGGVPKVAVLNQKTKSEPNKRHKNMPPLFNSPSVLTIIIILSDVNVSLLGI